MVIKNSRKYTINLAGVMAISSKNTLEFLMSQKNAVSSLVNKQARKKRDNMKCKKCGWVLEYVPHSFREQIEEIIGGQDRRGYWRCPNCNSKKSVKI